VLNERWSDFRSDQDKQSEKFSQLATGKVHFAKAALQNANCPLQNEKIPLEKNPNIQQQNLNLAFGEDWAAGSNP
jgi:hypothetical protein